MRKYLTTSSLSTRTPPDGERSHRELFVTRDAKLADQENVEGSLQRLRYLESHRHAAAR